MGLGWLAMVNKLETESNSATNNMMDGRGEGIADK
jgi:hypothetical protein